MAISAPSTSLNLIPQPPAKPLLGNLPAMNLSTPVQGLISLAREYGPIFRLTLPGRDLVVVSGFEIGRAHV